MFSGFVYYLGYITKFRLDTTLVPRSLGDFVTESWYLGVLALSFIFKFWLWPVWIFASMILLFFVVMHFAVYLKSKGIFYIADSITKENPGRKILGLTQWNWICWWKAVEDMYAWFVVTIVLLILPIFVLIQPFEKGKRDAQRQIEQLANHQCNPLKVKKNETACISLIDISASPNKVLFQGISVAANANRIAIYDGKVLEVWPLTNSMKVQKSVVRSVDSVPSTEELN
jgi:hypothetical protein